MAARKKWRLTYKDASDDFTTQKAAYDFVQALAAAWHRPDRGAWLTPHVTVWCSERTPHGWTEWRRYEDLDLSELRP